jgi:AcrR family transcriptional regulator
VRAATVLFAERGFEATTTQAIAEEAGIGAGTLFLYVRSKDDLLVRVVLGELDRRLDEAASRLEPGARLVDQVEVLFVDLAAFPGGDEELTRAFLRELLFTSEAERPAVRHLLDHFLDLVEGLVAAAQERGEVDPGVTPRDLAANLTALWFHVMNLRYGGHVPPDELAPRLRRAVEVQLGVVQPGRRARK